LPSWALIIITLNLVKCNTNFKEIAKIYSNLTNFNNLECPCCHSREIILWGFYERGVIYFEDNKCQIIKSSVIKTQRIKCKSCKKTHALLPQGIIPYKQITLELIMSILINIINTSIEKTADKFSMNINTIKKYWYQFIKCHLPLLVTFTRTRNLLNSLQLFSNSLQAQTNYIINFKCCFMQIKLGWLGVNAPHEVLPT